MDEHDLAVVEAMSRAMAKAGRGAPPEVWSLIADLAAEVRRLMAERPADERSEEVA